MNQPTANTFSDKCLVDKVLNGDRQAFSGIIRMTEGLVAQIVCKMIAGTEDRKDIAQDVYLKVYKNLSGFKFQSKLTTWVGQITYNTCISFLEKKKLLLPGELGDVEEGSGGHFSFDEKELSLLLVKETEKLPPVFRTLITLYHQQELGYSEIAQIPPRQRRSSPNICGSVHSAGIKWKYT